MLRAQLAAAGARLDGLYACVHHPSEGEPPYRAALRLPQAAGRGCSCGPPPSSASTSRRSTMVGDKASDLVPARTVGAGARARAHRLRARRVGVPARALRGRARPRRRRSARRRRVGAGPAGDRVSAARARLRAAVEAFRGRTVVVVGDLIADEYLFGKPSRISREAPVLILRYTEREVLLGGAANAEPQRARARRAGGAGRRGRPRRGRRRAARALPRRRHRDRRHRHRERPDDAGEDADHGRRLPGHAPAGGAARPRAGRRARTRSPRTRWWVGSPRWPSARTPSSSPTTATAR